MSDDALAHGSSQFFRFLGFTLCVALFLSLLATGCDGQDKEKGGVPQRNAWVTNRELISVTPEWVTKRFTLITVSETQAGRVWRVLSTHFINFLIHGI
ncbi:hypothetical protein ACFQGT_09730 [Natrialbaceae archaeon GCM10025810]|uniref:hypothetical protein n=1 Tax=Halovalidus salilacus TaxID=3075124 RepID=UPI003616BB45